MTEKKENHSFKFARLILLFDAVVILAAGYPLYVNYGAEMIVSVVLGLLLTSAVFIIALYLIEVNYQKSINKFMPMVMGGMLGKMVVLCGAILIVFIFSLLHQFGFTTAVLFSYLYKTVAEIIYINKISRKSRLPQ